MVFCSGCGEKIEGGVQFCSKCGKAAGGISLIDKRQDQKNTLLLVGFIVGALFLINSGIVLFAPIFPASKSIFGISVTDGTTSGFSAISNSLKGESFGPLVLVHLIVVFISTIAAVLVNLLAWIMNNAKAALAAALLYIVLAIPFFPLSAVSMVLFFPLSVISMVLCFIAYGQMKKENRAA